MFEQDFRFVHSRLTPGGLSPGTLSSVANLPALSQYRNTTPVLTIASVELCVQDVLKAAAIGGLPVLLVSGTGDGKSLLAREVADRWFAGKAITLRGDGGEPPAKAFLRTNLASLMDRSARSDADLIESDEALGYGFCFIDELNRLLISPLQNDFFSIVDGHLAFRGKTYALGRGQFFVMAAMNLGDEYSATQVLDEALRRRFPIILDLDRYAASLEDYVSIQPRPQGVPRECWREEIRTAQAGLRQAFCWPPSGLRLAKLYVLQHLNRCTSLGQPKRLLGRRLPGLCETNACPHMERSCHRLRPIPVATLDALEHVTLALEAVALARAARHGQSVPLDLQQQVLDYLECVRVFLPVWDKLLLKESEFGTEQELANELVAGVVDSFERHWRAISDLVVGRAAPSELELGEWGEIVTCMLEAAPLEAFSAELAHGT